MKMEIKNFKAVSKGSLQGFLEIYLPELGWTLKDCGLFSANGKSWINMPQKTYKDKEGKEKYFSLIHMDEDKYKAFGVDALEAYKKFSQQKPPEPQEDIFDLF